MSCSYKEGHIEAGNRLAAKNVYVVSPLQDERYALTPQPPL